MARPKGNYIADRILRVLADGQPHSAAELVACLQDELATPESLSVHLGILRRRLKLYDEFVLSSGRGKGLWYRKVKPAEPMEPAVASRHYRLIRHR